MTKATRTLHFLSVGRSIRLEAFLPPGPGPFPALLLLHGASGMNGGHGYIPQVAAVLAEHGLAALLVRYFDATETTQASDAAIWQHFDRWLQAIDDAITATAQLPEIDARHLGLVGYSLGGYLAVAQSSRDRRIRAVVEFAGGIDPEFAKGVTHLPPTLIVHGEADRRVPFHRADELQAVLKQVHAPCETRFFPGEGHLLSPAAALESLRAALSFLERHLGPKSRPTTHAPGRK